MGYLKILSVTKLSRFSVPISDSNIQNSDLVMRMEISLRESLCGFQRDIRTLGTETQPVRLQVPPGTIVKDKMLYTVKGEGFPHYRNPFERGNLIIQFHVNYPDVTDYATYLKHLDDVKELFPPEEERKAEDDSDQYEEVELVDFDPAEHSTAIADPWDEDEDGPKSGVKCQNS